MANLIVAEPFRVTADHDNWKLYRSTTRDGTYSLVVTQALTDLSYVDEAGDATSWYKITYENSTSTDEYPALADVTPFQGESFNYTTPKRVQQFLNIQEPNETDLPTIQRIVELIQEKEDEIDYRTGHSWRIRYSGTTSGRETTAREEYHDVDFLYEYQTGVPVFLAHREVRNFSAADGDSLEVWNGNEYDDWITTRTEGRDNDWWLDNRRGILHLKTRYGIVGPAKVRVKYRYGEQALNLMVREICTKMVARDLLTNESRAVFLQEGGGASLSYQERVQQWNADIEKKMLQLKEFGMPIALSTH